jgi:hypothetical protein
MGKQLARCPMSSPAKTTKAWPRPGVMAYGQDQRRVQWVAQYLDSHGPSILRGLTCLYRTLDETLLVSEDVKAVSSRECRAV